MNKTCTKNFFDTPPNGFGSSVPGKLGGIFIAKMMQLLTINRGLKCYRLQKDLLKGRRETEPASGVEPPTC